MSIDLVKRVVALQRTVASYTAMMNKGLITLDECRFLVDAAHKEIAAIRSQADLPLEQSSAGQAVPGGAAKAGTKG
nr:MAG: hypothetical protein [Microvirus sp.]